MQNRKWINFKMKKIYKIIPSQMTGERWRRGSRWAAIEQQQLAAVQWRSASSWFSDRRVLSVDLRFLLNSKTFMTDFQHESTLSSSWRKRKSLPNWSLDGLFPPDSSKTFHGGNIDTNFTLIRQKRRILMAERKQTNRSHKQGYCSKTEKKVEQTKSLWADLLSETPFLLTYEMEKHWYQHNSTIQQSGF